MKNKHTPVPRSHRKLPISERGRYVCLTLGQLAVAAANHEEILTAGGVQALSASLEVDDGETVFNACYALNKLAMAEGNNEVMV